MTDHLPRPVWRDLCTRCTPGTILAAALLAIPAVLHAQEMSFAEYEPKSMLVVPEHPVERARYPFIDVHTHPNGMMPPDSLDITVAQMDVLNMAVMVNLSGRSGAALKAIVGNMKGRYPGRFVVFANPSYDGIDDADYPDRTARQLEEDVRNGAQGLKIWKNLGMYVTDSAGRRVPVDDPRLDPLWAKAGELGIPVIIHTADPAAFWLPYDEHNERWLELTERPNRRREGEPTFEQLISEQFNMFAKHPKTTFIAAHLAWMGSDLGHLGELLDAHPNVYTEIGAVIYDPGRQPRFAREFFTRYQDRVLFGKDVWEPSEYPVYFRTLETADEYFDYYRKRHAFWKLYGLDLPDEVLRKLYYENALRIIPGIDRSLFPDTN
jgi:predicted TIM-barrel fold metal-dependent hydrolase